MDKQLKYLKLVLDVFIMKQYTSCIYQTLSTKKKIVMHAYLERGSLLGMAVVLTLTYLHKTYSHAYYACGIP